MAFKLKFEIATIVFACVAYDAVGMTMTVKVLSQPCQRYSHHAEREGSPRIF